MQRITTRGGDGFVAAGVAIAALVLYSLTLCPTVPPGDSGELIAAAHGGGVAHPPGYPLFTMLAAVADHAAPGWQNPAVRVNLLNAIFAAGAAALVYLVARRTDCGKASAIFAASCYALTTTVWRYAVVAEVFALNTLLSLGVILAALEWFTRRTAAQPARTRGRTYKPAFGTGLLAGLALSNHHTAILVLAALAGVYLTILIRERAARLMLGRDLAGGALGLMIGLLPYLYLPIAAMNNAPVSWGATNTVAGFVQHVVRADYGSLQLIPGDVDTSALSWHTHIGLFLVRLTRESRAIVPLFAVVGVAAVARRRSYARVVIILSLLMTGGVFLLLVNAPLEPELLKGVVARFYILPIAFAAILAGVGLQSATALINMPRVRMLTQSAIVAVAVAGLLVANYRAADHRENFVTHDLGANVLESLPAGAVLFTRGDLLTNAVKYQRYVRRLRPDVLIIDQELLTYRWYVAALRSRAPGFTLPGERYDGVYVTNRAIIDANRAQFPIFFFDFKETSYQAAYVDESFGIVRRIVPRATPTALPTQQRVNAAIWAQYEKRSLHGAPDHESFEHLAMGFYSELLFNLGWLSAQTGAYDDGARYYERALVLRPDDYRIHRNLGALLSAHLGRPAAAADHLEQSLRLKPDMADADQLRAAIQTLRKAAQSR